MGNMTLIFEVYIRLQIQILSKLKANLTAALKPKEIMKTQPDIVKLQQSNWLISRDA